jgi:hypothetical protein
VGEAGFGGEGDDEDAGGESGKAEGEGFEGAVGEGEEGGGGEPGSGDFAQQAACGAGEAPCDFVYAVYWSWRGASGKCRG